MTKNINITKSSVIPYPEIPISRKAPRTNFERRAKQRETYAVPAFWGTSDAGAGATVPKSTPLEKEWERMDKKLRILNCTGAY